MLTITVDDSAFRATMRSVQEGLGDMTKVILETAVGCAAFSPDSIPTPLPGQAFAKKRPNAKCFTMRKVLLLVR